VDCYLDVVVREDPEVNGHQIMATLFTKLHKALVLRARGDIAVSFPEHDPAVPTLGPRLRVHATERALSELMAGQWLSGMLDHVDVGRLSSVPSQAQYRAVRRVQAKSNPERLRRRLAKRHTLTAEEARGRIPDSAANLLRHPFLQLRSVSTGEAFRLFVHHGSLVSAPVTGPFGSYGLSPTATVPWF